MCARVRLQHRLDDPHAVQFVTQVLGIDVQRREDVGEGEIAAVQPVGVVGDVDFALADELPVVAVDGAVEHVELVGGAQPVGGGAGVVVGDVRRPAHPALAGIVGPGVAGLADLVHGLVDEQQVAGQPRRGEHPLLEQDHRVVERLLGHAGERVAQLELDAEFDQRVVAAAGDGGLADDAGRGLAPVAQQVVPDRLQPVGGDGERDSDDGAADSVAAVHQRGRGGGRARRVVDALRRRRAAPRRIDRHGEGLVGLQHPLVADREAGAVGVDVAGVDGEQRAVGGVGVAVVLADDVARRRRGYAAGPFGDGAVGAARPLAAERRQVGPEAGDLVGGEFGRGRRGGGEAGQGERERGAAAQGKRGVGHRRDLRTNSWRRRRRSPGRPGSSCRRRTSCSSGRPARCRASRLRGPG